MGRLPKPPNLSPYGITSSQPMRRLEQLSLMRGFAAMSEAVVTP